MANYRTQIYAAAIISFSATLGLCHSAWGQSSASPDTAELIEALKEKGGGKTRGLTLGKTSAESDRVEKRRRVIEALRRREKTRGLSVEERPTLVVTEQEDFDKDYRESKEGRPFADIVIYFDYNAAVIRSRSKPDLAELGRALLNREFSGKTFIIEGHTDARGGNEYNQTLSERRARAVKIYLVNYLDVPESNLTIIGRGETELKLPEQPNAGENRRVQVINMGQVAEAD